jgi:hypothetical protein
LCITTITITYKLIIAIVVSSSHIAAVHHIAITISTIVVIDNRGNIVIIQVITIRGGWTGTVSG